MTGIVRACESYCSMKKANPAKAGDAKSLI